MTIKHNGVTYKAVFDEFYEVDVTDITEECEQLAKYSYLYALSVNRADAPDDTDGAAYTAYFYPDNDEPSEKSVIYGVWEHWTCRWV